jgi:hypothetical protein
MPSLAVIPKDEARLRRATTGVGAQVGDGDSSDGSAPARRRGETTWASDR